jgi:diadenosine tetraphosphatase ApaH/serine/threonine PP2A family protein phosphatase
MKLAILSDIHGNLDALDACIAHARRAGAQGWACLGDIVGYGADPAACIDRVRELTAAGGIVVRGNHDTAALGGLNDDMNFVAREVAGWTRTALDAAQRAYLAALPLSVARGDALFVHASADKPDDWEYIAGTLAAGRCMAATAARIVFAGHVHVPLLYFSARGGMRAFTLTAGTPVPLTPGRRWLALVGAVGQPRDGNPAAAYALYDEASGDLVYQRVPYDWTAAAAKIRAAGLPEILAARLEYGE